MMHKDKLVVSLKVNGHFVREFVEDDHNPVYYVPFGSEYSLWFKNLHTQKAVANVTIDGKEAIKGLVIPAITSFNHEVELERFYRSSTNKGYKFKFVEKTDQIREHKGESPEDGLIIVTFDFEKKVEYLPITPRFAGSWGGGTRAMYSASIDSSPKNDEGLTVEGSESNQSFHTVTMGPMENTPSSIVLKLRGDIGQKKIKNPVLQRENVECKNCGKQNKRTYKFCPDCGTNVEASLVS
jgi:hypothetical protein